MRAAQPLPTKRMTSSGRKGLAPSCPGKAGGNWVGWETRVSVISEFPRKKYSAQGERRNPDLCKGVSLTILREGSCICKGARTVGKNRTKRKKGRCPRACGFFREADNPVYSGNKIHD